MLDLTMLLHHLQLIMRFLHISNSGVYRRFHDFSVAMKIVARPCYMRQMFVLFIPPQVCILGDCMGSVLAYDILTSMQTCPSPSPMSPSSPAHSPPPAPPTCSVSNGNDASVCPTGEVGRRKFLTTPSSSRKASQNVRRCILFIKI